MLTGFVTSLPHFNPVLAMDRMDLASKAHVGSQLNDFRGEFDF